MLKVSIIPTLSIWIIVTSLRIDNHTVEADINNPSNTRPTLVNSSEENHSVNSVMIDEEKTTRIGTTLCKNRSSLLDTIYAKSKYTSSNLYDNPTAGVRLKPISIEKTNRTSGVDKLRIHRRFINVAAESDAAFDRDDEKKKIERDIENVDDFRGLNLNELSFGFGDKNLTNRDNASSVFDNYIVKSRRSLLEFDHKTAKLTLADFNGPSISQDVESLMDGGSRGSEHIRVKRDLSDSDSLDEIRDDKDFTARFKDDDKSENRNDFEQKISIERKRLDHETGFPNADAEVRSSIGEGKTGAENLDVKLKRRKKSHVSQLELVRVSRGGKKKSRHKSRKHKHRKRPKSHRHNKKMAKYTRENDGKLNDDNKFIETTVKLSNKPRDISAVVADDLQVESRVEKRDSGDAKSEIEVKKKREVSKGGEIELASKSSETTLTAKVDSSPLTEERKDRGAIDGEDLLRVKRHERARSVENDKTSNRASFCRPGKRADDFKYYDDIHESDRIQRDGIEPRIADGGKKTRRERAAKSIDEIKDLMGKIIGKVDELDSYVRTKGDGDERRVEIKRKKKLAEEEVPSNLTRCVDADLKNIKKSEDSKSLVDKTDGDFKSKLETERSGKLADDRRTGEITSQDRKRSTGTTKRNGDSDKARKKRKPHRKWDRWTDWSSCSVTCGKGRQIRWRHCVHDCTLAETEMEEKTCQLPACGPGKFLGIF